MDYLQQVLSELNARLPELEWKIRDLSLSHKNIPHGLFRIKHGLSGNLCVEEIRADILTLSRQNNDRGIHYLAQRIQRKIDVLVTLCQIDNRKSKPVEKVSFGLNSLSTRQQWLKTLEQDIQALTIQKLALTKTLEQKKSTHNATTYLNLSAELGEIDKRLTLAQEAFNHSIEVCYD